MDFTRFRFLGFLALVAVLFRLCPQRFRPLLLLIASYAFYFTWSVRLSLLLAAATLAAFAGARLIESSQNDRVRRGLMLALVGGLAGTLTLFKASLFLPDVLKHHLLMPLGISYYTFKLISYVVDVYWGKCKAERSLIPFAAYVSFFPQMVGGPIQRSESLLPQIHHPPTMRLGNITLGVQRIMLGYFKKFVVADNLAMLADFVYSHLHASGTPVILGFYAYPLQLYADFSGLTDIAIGAALVLGFESPENFNAPFLAVSPSEFWRRWHITLTTWLTDYVFTPLRMATRSLGNLGLVLSILINMVLIGLWHGFRMGFVLFGVLHAAYLSIDALTGRLRKRFYKNHHVAERLTDWIGPIVTFHLVAVATVFFRADLVRDGFYVLGHLGQGISAPSADFLALWRPYGWDIRVGAAAYLLLELADYMRRRYPSWEIFYRLPRWGRWSVYSCTAMTLAVMVAMLLTSAGGNNAFIYAVF